MFLDASVIVAILRREPGFEQILARIEAHGGKIYTSALARFESVVSLARAIAQGEGGTRPTPELIETVKGIVDRFLAELGAADAAISGGIGTAAIDAAARYGKIVGHPADLNFGDCFAYACARSYRLALVYKGDDFVHTDLA